MSESGIMHGGVMVAEVEVRVLTGERHRISAQATRYGVESGKSIVDHVILQPNEVEITFEMTNSNRGAEQARAVFIEYVKKIEARQHFTLDTEHARYKNMVITGFSPDHRAPNKGAYSATLRLSQVGIVGDTELVSDSGGRPPRVLDKDGTDKTACSYINSGQKNAITDRALMERCLAKLANSPIRRLVA